MQNATAETWVVYSMPVKGNPDRMRAVCARAEWEAMAPARSGLYTLVLDGIANEGEAERLARGTSGTTVRRNPYRTPVASPGQAVAVPAGPQAAV